MKGQIMYTVKNNILYDNEQPIYKPALVYDTKYDCIMYIGENDYVENQFYLVRDTFTTFCILEDTMIHPTTKMPTFRLVQFNTSHANIHDIAVFFNEVTSGIGNISRLLERFSTKYGAAKRSIRQTDMKRHKLKMTTAMFDY